MQAHRVAHVPGNRPHARRQEMGAAPQPVHRVPVRQQPPRQLTPDVAAAGDQNR